MGKMTVSNGEIFNVDIFSKGEIFEDIGLMKKAVEKTLEVNLNQKTTMRRVTLGRMLFIKMYTDKYKGKVSNIKVYKMYMPTRNACLNTYYIKTANALIETDGEVADKYNDCLAEYENIYMNDRFDIREGRILECISSLIDKIVSQKIIDKLQDRLLKHSAKLKRRH